MNFFLILKPLWIKIAVVGRIMDHKFISSGSTVTVKEEFLL